ncbi:AI-2E family transporter [Arenimonas caeni]|uniref:AI-2E family transporter n=1 Tax=Arenimonas caeni TaxID=2058085 RepID=A0A2P6MBP9_9GAMM|nr:AI-2E family transporter [Arenimonas caeni]PRH83424.1 AI-2E family transporter [Arenimonas caeni]
MIPAATPDPFSDQRRWQWLALAAGVGVLLWLLGPILTPFVVSALLAWLGEPLVRRIEARGRSRTTAVLLVFTLMSLGLVLAVLLLIPLVENQVSKFIDWLPRFGQWLTGTAVPWAEQRFDLELAGYIDPSQLIQLLRQYWQEAGGIATTIIGEVSKSGLAILGWAANLALIPVVTFYFMRDGASMLGKASDLLPRPVEPLVTRLACESDQVLGGFIRGQLSVMIALGTIYAVGLTAVGVDLGILIGLVAGLVSFVPYLGAIVGLGAAVIATLVQHGDLMHLALVLGVFGLGQLLESFWLTPWLVGDKIGLHPVAVIFAIMAGGQLFGFLGVLLALPVAAVAVVVGRYAHERYTRSKLYGADESPLIVAGSAGTDGPAPREPGNTP